jgi:hypothetical protein
VVSIANDYKRGKEVKTMMEGIKKDLKTMKLHKVKQNKVEGTRESEFR